MDVFVIVVCTVAATAVAALAISYLIYWYSKRKAERVTLNNTLQEVAAAMRDVVETLKAVPSLVHGLTEVSKVQVAELEKLIESISSLRTLLFSGDDNKGYQEYSEKDASREYQIQETMKVGGVTRKEAEDRIREADVYRHLRVSQ